MIVQYEIIYKLMFSIVTVIALYASTSLSCNHVCESSKGIKSILSYPFGFSSSCPIQLSCNSSTGDITIRELVVRNISDDRLIVGLPDDCSRSIVDFRNILSNNFALSSKNALLLMDCNTSSIQTCIVPVTTLSGVFSQSCNKDRNISCYSANKTQGDSFLDYNMLPKDCGRLFSSILVHDNESKSVDLVGQTVELGWRIFGKCNCSIFADCISDNFPDPGGYRCRCKQGFIGDGYPGSTGCRKADGGGSSRHILPVVGGLATFIVVVIAILYFFITRYKMNMWGSLLNQKDSDSKVEVFMRQFGSVGPKQYSYSDVKNMTNSFAHKLGQGGYGSVYKGSLSDGRLVAVKVLSETKGNGEDFINEVSTISKTSHVNIVALLGFSYRKNRRALVYQFMPNGSLDEFIHGKGSPSSTCCLNWNTLLKIAIGVARGLEYLHRDCNIRIVHLDIKPHNILLDDDFCPKISDFGLAKLSETKVSIFSKCSARGTIGYIAPEVIFRNFGGVSHKSDVYSYGMMVLEMAGVRTNPLEMQADRSSELYFPNWIYEHLEHGTDLPSSVIQIDAEEEGLRRKLIIVGLRCIQTNPSGRPSMNEVLEMLEDSFQALRIPPKQSLLYPISDVTQISSIESDERYSESNYGIHQHLYEKFHS